jgi:peptidoglycan/xylan/chitin deacetylase (PgdA/CDA1 family)
VLGYHAVQDWSDDPALRRYAIPRPVFADHLASLASRGFYFVGPEMAAGYFAEGAPLPRRAVLLTFDDCYADLPAVARDILQPRSIEALAFAVSGVKSGTNEWDRHRGGPPRGLLKPRALRQLPDLGIEVGSHSRTHRSLVSLTNEELRSEAAGAADDIEALGLPRPRFFAYPYGEVDDEARKAVRDACFIAAFGIGEGWVDRTSDRFNLPRVIVHTSDRGWRFRLRTTAPALYERLDLAQARLRAKLRKAAALLSGAR